MSEKGSLDKRMVYYIIEDVQKDLEYYIQKLELAKQRIEKEIR